MLWGLIYVLDGNVGDPDGIVVEDVGGASLHFVVPFRRSGEREVG